MDLILCYLVSRVGSVESTVYNFSTPNSKENPYFIQELNPGRYLFECWGASGGDETNGGYGGYISGVIRVNKTTNFYVVVGSMGVYNYGGFNGGGAGGVGINVANPSPNGYGGGGATDIRTGIDKSNIIIIAGGGGGCSGYVQLRGGHAGGLSGLPSRNEAYDDNYCNGSPLALGGSKDTGTKWQGANGGSKTIIEFCGSEGNGGGGGGYYGGQISSGSGLGSDSGGGGGSSCISGHPDCDVIDGIYFSSIFIYNGSELMPSPYGDLERGHYGNGYAKITRIIITPTGEIKPERFSGKYLFLV